MLSSNEKLRDALREWREAGEKTSVAIVNRDYEACIRAKNVAAFAFNRLIAALDEGASLKAFSKEALASAEVWRRNIGAMPDWMDSVKEELDLVKRRIMAKRKLNSAYGLDGKVCGRHLKVKAR